LSHIYFRGQQAIKQRLDIRTGCQVLKILQAPNGRVTGVLARNKYGELFSVQASAVVLAAGGFSANLARVVAYRPAYAGFSSTNQPGATGDGMDLGAAVGGELIDMDQIQIHPTQAAGSKILITEAVRGNGAILVNRLGKRFVNELTTRDAASAAVLKQPGGSAFLIFDTALRKSLSQIEGYYHLELVREGTTPAALAAAIGVDAKTLEQTLDTYNGFQAARNDAEFKRPDLPRALKTGPFVSLEIRPGIHYTMGGLRIDARTRVLKADRTPIAGLFAAGEVTGGVHGANRLGGNSISETITFGRIAAAQASAYVKELRQLKLG
jgi:fumarate reductase flavoprotein subunit